MLTHARLTEVLQYEPLSGVFTWRSHVAAKRQLHAGGLL